MAQRDVRKMTDDLLFASWSDWIKRTADELVEVYTHRFMFLEIRRMFDTNPALHTVGGGFVLELLARLFGRDAIMFVRREYDTEPGTINPLKLLGEMEKRPQVLKRSRYRAFWAAVPTRHEQFNDEMANQYFDRFALVRPESNRSPDDYLDPAGIAADRTRLEAETKTVRAIAHRLLAHRTPPAEVQPVDFPSGLEKPLEAILECFNKYYPLLTGSSMSSPTAVIQFDWTECFQVPWATEEYFRNWRAERERKGREESQKVLDRMTGKTPSRGQTP